MPTTYSTDEDVRGYAIWRGDDGSFYYWPQATKDNRVSRVLARIRRYGMAEPIPGTLLVTRDYDRACKYADALGF